jgi:hypothetical protein
MSEPTFNFDALERRAMHARGRASRTLGRAEVRLTAEQIAVLVETFRAVEARAAAAEAAVQRVREIHADMNAWSGGPAECGICCDEGGPLPWPCPTVRSLDASSQPADALLPLSGGEPVHDHRDDDLPAGLEWTEDDERDYMVRTVTGFPVEHHEPRLPESMTVAQFRAGLEDTRRHLDGVQ